ncbi:MAG: hypothetical protein FD144_5794 [Rhodospirillaceae bacterium]|nr:MAG: hypothetical protein FD144_5794 [Rhodospirillaceae bacterium]
MVIVFHAASIAAEIWTASPNAFMLLKADRCPGWPLSLSPYQNYPPQDEASKPRGDPLKIAHRMKFNHSKGCDSDRINAVPSRMRIVHRP